MDQQEEENKYVSIIEQLESMKLIEDMNLKLITLKKTKINFLRNHILDIQEKHRIELMENDKLFDVYYKNEVNNPGLASFNFIYKAAIWLHNKIMLKF
jgi:hypothetical protein